MKDSDSLTSFGWCIVISLCIIAVASLAIFRRASDRKKLLAEKLSLEQEIDLLKRRSEQFRKERTSLQSDPVAVEREAREQFGVTRPGETMYDKIALSLQAVQETKPPTRVLPKPHPRLFDRTHWRAHVLIVIGLLMAMIALMRTREDGTESG